MDLLFWIFLVNATILIVHEIDSAYWKEWRLVHLGDRAGLNGFILLHLPLVFLILLGSVLVYEDRTWGMIISLVLAAAGLFAFFFHSYHLWKGKPEFNTLLSKGLILSTLGVSIVQAVLTIRQLI